jgi:COP9 signalosome complex subunit 6
LTIYESSFEADDAPKKTGEDEEMQDGEPTLGLKFNELPYTIETGEAEFISVDFVARGGGNATAVDGTVKKPTTSKTTEATPSTTDKAKGKGKTKKSEDSEKEPKLDEAHILTREDEEAIASLTAKANAIKMLHARINLIATYLQQLPPSYISGGEDADGQQYTPVNHEILRSIQALLSRLTLLIPADSIGFEKELISEQNDVSLVNLLNTITQSVKEVRELGKKFSVVDGQKNQKLKGGMWDHHSGGLGGNGVLGVGDLLT